MMKAYRACSVAERAVLEAALLRDTTHLAKDPFANYLLQEVVRSSPVAAAKVGRGLTRTFALLSGDKYGSNVVQAVLRACGESRAVRGTAVAELVYDGDALRALVRDPYGNFVVQTLLETAATAAELEALAVQVGLVVGGTAYETNIVAKGTARYGVLAPGRRLQWRCAAVQRARCVRGTRLCDMLRVVRGALSHRHAPYARGGAVYVGNVVVGDFVGKSVPTGDGALALAVACGKAAGGAATRTN